MARIGSLKVNWNTYLGSIFLTPDFQNQPPLIRADLLQDIIADLQDEYIKALEEMRGENGKPA